MAKCSSCLFFHLSVTVLFRLIHCLKHIVLTTSILIKFSSPVSRHQIEPSLPGLTANCLDVAATSRQIRSCLSTFHKDLFNFCWIVAVHLNILEHAMQTASAQDVLEHARNTIRPGGWTCEWNIAGLNKPIQCRTVLVSWNAYLKHILKHCQENRHRTNSYTCQLPRCSMPSGVPISSYKELVNHLTTSHLNRSSLNCPVIGCNSLSFRGPSALQAHLSDVHFELLRQTASTSSSDLFLPSWLPFRQASKQVASIPTYILPGSILVDPVEGTWRARPSTPRRLSSGKPNYASPRKPSKMDVSNNSNPNNKGRAEDTQDQHEIVFDDLPQQLNDSKTYFRNPEYECVIREMGPYLDVSRPQPPLDPSVFGYRVLPETILYHAWVRQHQDILNQGDDDEEAGEEKDEGAKNGISASSS